MRDRPPAIVSRNNPKIKQIRSLRLRKRRDETGLFIVEGIRHIGEAVEAGMQVDSLCYAPDLLSSTFALELLMKQQARGITCLAFEAETFSSLADKENPQGILAVVRKQTWKLDQLHPGNFPWGVALVAPQDPGNIGTILRTIDAVGASGLLLLENSADPYHPSAVRASMGTLFWYPVVQASFVEFLQWSKKQAYTLVGTSAHDSLDYRQVEQVPFPLILLLGSEREGLSAEQRQACDRLLRLPMHGRATSLNLAVAAGVLLYAIERAIADRGDQGEGSSSAEE
jgi:TrmH family RNA methyltransferase